jgi:fatty acid-binding protein DegV
LRFTNLKLREKKIRQLNRQRTKKRARARLIEIVKEQCPKSADAHLYVMQADAETEARKLAASLMSEFGGGEIPIYELPPAIVVHAGPGTLAVGFFAI